VNGSAQENFMLIFHVSTILVRMRQMQTSIKMGSFQHVPIVPAVQSLRYVHHGDQSIPDVSKRLITALSSKL
jgi:hypothetical protein